MPVKFRQIFYTPAKSMCTINCDSESPAVSENRQRLPVIGTYLRITPRLRVRGWLSLRRILIVRDSPRKILGGSFLQLRYSSISPVFQCATNTSVPATDAATLTFR